MGRLGIGDDDVGGGLRRLRGRHRRAASCGCCGSRARRPPCSTAGWQRGPGRSSLAPPPVRPPTRSAPRPWPADARWPRRDRDGAARPRQGRRARRTVGDRYRGETEPGRPRGPATSPAPATRPGPPTSTRRPVGSATPPRCGSASRPSASTPGRRSSAYCGSGVSACADLLALERAGVGRTGLYVASWSGWSADPARPAAAAAGSSVAPQCLTPTSAASSGRVRRRLRDLRGTVGAAASRSIDWFEAAYRAYLTGGHRPRHRAVPVELARRRPGRRRHAGRRARAGPCGHRHRRRAGRRRRAAVGQPGRAAGAREGRGAPRPPGPGRPPQGAPDRPR